MFKLIKTGLFVHLASEMFQDECGFFKKHIHDMHSSQVLPDISSLS